MGITALGLMAARMLAQGGYDFAASHPAVHAWLGRIAALPGWRAPYDLLPGKRMQRYR